VNIAPLSAPSTRSCREPTATHRRAPSVGTPTSADLQTRPCGSSDVSATSSAVKNSRRTRTQEGWESAYSNPLHRQPDSPGQPHYSPIHPLTIGSGGFAKVDSCVVASQSPYEVFREMPDHLACVLTWWDGEKVQFHVVVNPSSTEDDAEGLTEWFAGVARRIEEYGLSRAV